MGGRAHNIKRGVILYNHNDEMANMVNAIGGTADQEWMPSYKVPVIYLSFRMKMVPQVMLNKA